MDNSANKKTYLLLGLIIAILLAVNSYFILKLNSSPDLAFEKPSAESSKNEKIISFFGLFVEKVLKSGEEIDFDTRLNLENSVRATGDQDLVAQWQKFTNSKTEESAQIEVKNLLGMIAEKIK